MKRFPFARLKISQASISSSLTFNPYSDIPPKCRWTIDIGIEPLKLGDDAAMPDFEQVVDSNICLERLELEIASWRSLAGRFTFSEPQGGSFYVSHAHNPIDILDLTMTPKDGACFDVDATVEALFEYEGAGYQNEVTRLVFPATYEGFRFQVPTWSDPADVVFPPEWQVPSVEPSWTDQEIREFLSHHINLSDHMPLTIEKGQFVEAKPRTAA